VSGFLVKPLLISFLTGILDKTNGFNLIAGAMKNKGLSGVADNWSQLAG
jgi:hypothetical protein